MGEQPEGPVTGSLAVSEWARDALAREPWASYDLTAVADAALDIGSAHPTALTALLVDGRQAVSALTRDTELRAAWLLRLRRFRLRVAELEDRGLIAGYLVVGVVDVGGAEVPALLGRCRVRPAVGQDAHVELSGGWLLNPALVTAVARRTAGTVDLAQVLLPGAEGEAAHGHRDATEDPLSALDDIGRALHGTGLAVRRRVVVAPVTMDAGRVGVDLDRVQDWLVGHRVLESVTVGGRPAPVLDTEPPDHGIPDPAVLDAAIDDLVGVPLDADQLASVRAVLAGRHVALDAPPGTGATHVGVAIATLAATTGRRCLVVTPTRTQGDVVHSRLRAAGLEAHVVRGAQPDASAPGTAPAPPTPQRDAREWREMAAGRFAEASADLTRIRDPWQVSRLDVLDALARLDAAPPSPVVHWPSAGSTGEAGAGEAAGRDAPAPLVAPLESIHRVVDALQRAIGLGLLDPATDGSPWSAAEITEAEAAARAAELCSRISGFLGAEAARAADQLAQTTGTAPAATLSDLRERQRLFAGLQATLDKLTPEVFDVPIDDLVAATGTREYRAGVGVELPSVRRRRLVTRARRLVRPGIDVDTAALHDLLAQASAQRIEWQRLSGGAGWAHVPAEVPGRLRVIGEFLDACDGLAEVHPGFGGQATVDEVVTLAGALAAAAGEVAVLPERGRLRQVWVSRGLGPMIDTLLDVVRREAGAETPIRSGAARRAAAAVWRAWWTAVAMATHPDPGDGPVTVQSLREHADASAAHRRDAPVRAAAAIRALGHAPPVRVVVPAELADVEDGERYDVVVLDDAAALPFAEVVAGIARGVQIVALGDLDRGIPVSALEVLRTAQGTVRSGRLGRRHRPVPVPLAAGGGPDGPGELLLADPARALVFTHVEGAAGLPPEGDDYVDTSDAEVGAVVDLALDTALAGWRADPRRSLAVIALTRTHAAAIRASTEHGPPFTAEQDEPVVVVSADQARGLERDVVLLSLGFPRTPHGRVLHRFGPLDSDEGAALVATAVTRARQRLHVVSGLRSGDLDPGRLRGAGARSLSALLVGAELSDDASQVDRPPAMRSPVGALGTVRAAADDRDDLDFPRRGGLGDGRWVEWLVAVDLEERGLSVALGPDGHGLAVTADGGAPVAVDLDVAFGTAAEAEARSLRLAESGWPHVVVAVEDVAAHRTGTVDDVVRLVLPDGGAALVRRRRRPPPLPERSSDDRDVGWGEGSEDGDQRILAERPPHW